MDHLFLSLPILIPMGTLIFSLAMARWLTAQRVVSITGAFALLAAGVVLLLHVLDHGPVAMQFGNWPAPFGITFVADLLSAIMVVLGGLMGFAVSIYSLSDMDKKRLRFGFHPLYHLLLLGISGSFLTGDLFNLFVWFEVMLIASFVLITLGGERSQLEGAIKYVTLNLIASTIFLSAVGLLYATVGTLNMADLSVRLQQGQGGAFSLVIAMMLFISFGLKAAVFPLFAWLPASYHTPPVTVSAIFAGMLTKVGVYALLRAFTLLFVQDTGFSHTLILVVAGFTMVTGVLGAAAQNETRRILSFHIVSQIGYMILGLGLLTPLGILGTVFYLVHHIIVKTNLFLISGVIRQIRGSHLLEKIGGLYRSHPWLAALFLIPAMSLAGIPPLSGFWAKMILIRASFENGQWIIGAVALVVSLLTLFSMTKIWNQAFWKRAPDDAEKAPVKLSAGQLTALYTPIVLLASLTVLLGLFPELITQISEQAASQLLHPGAYIEAVLGDSYVTEVQP